MKLLADINGEPLLNHTIRCLLDAGVDRVVLVLSAASALESVPLLHDPRVSTAVNPDPSRGMFSSIQTGLSVSDADFIVIVPADMPFVASASVRAAVARAAETSEVTVPVFQGRRGHPVVVPGRYRAALLDSAPTASLKSALSALAGAPGEIGVDDPGVLRDVDIPADL